MEKYKWTLEQVEYSDMVKTLDLEFGDWKEIVKNYKPLGSIDDIKGL